VERWSSSSTEAERCARVQLSSAAHAIQVQSRILSARDTLLLSLTGGILCNEYSIMTLCVRAASRSKPFCLTVVRLVFSIFRFNHKRRKVLKC
jgi:hypothetical protein